MRIPLMLFALASITPAVMPIAMARTQDPPAAQEEQAKKIMVATVVAVNAEQKTIKIQEMSDPIFITGNTLFDDDVQLDKLHAGTKVKIVGTATTDGKFQAAEIRVPK